MMSSICDRASASAGTVGARLLSESDCRWTQLPLRRDRHLFRIRVGHTTYRPISFRHAPAARALALRSLLRADLPATLGALLIPSGLDERYWSAHLAGAIGAAVRRAMAGEA